MYFHRHFFSIIVIHQIGHAHSQIIDLNSLDGRDLETSLFNDGPLLMADANNQINPCTGQVDQQLSSSFSNSNVNLFTRDPKPENEQCLPPVNIGADVHVLGSGVLNLFKDPISELEQLVTKDKASGGTGGPNGLGSGPETPGVPPRFNPFDDEEEDDWGTELFPDSEEEEGWVPYEGDVWGPEGFKDGSYGSERRVDEEETDDKLLFGEDEDEPCNSITTPAGYQWDLCCDGPPYLPPITTNVAWKYDAVEGCDWGKFFSVL